MRRILVILVAVSLVSLPGTLAQPTLSLRLTTGNGEPVLCSRLSPGTVITLEFTHSMFGGYVRETYRVDRDGWLERQRIVTERAAAAEYYAMDGRTRHAADGHEVLAPAFATNELIIRVGQRGDHRLTVDGTTHHLAGQLTEPTQVRITTERISQPAWRSSCR